MYSATWPNKALLNKAGICSLPWAKWSSPLCRIPAAVHTQVSVWSGRLPHFWERRYHPGLILPAGRAGGQPERGLASCCSCLPLRSHKITAVLIQRQEAGSSQTSHIFRSPELLYFWLGSHLWKVVPLLMETHPFLLFVQLREGEREIQKMYELGTFENYVSASELLIFMDHAHPTPTPQPK